MVDYRLELDFQTTSLETICEAFFNNGCVLLRGFVTPESLAAMGDSIDALGAMLTKRHLTAADLKERGLPQFHESLFSQKHHDLLRTIFGKKYEVDESTATRHIDPAIRNEQTNGPWQRPLGPHLDAFFHSFDFTVNFWLPFQSCGVDTPRLGVVSSSFYDIVQYVGYDGGREGEGTPHVWNLPRFSPAMRQICQAEGVHEELLRTTFGDRTWVPLYSLGDAMMLSNWTFHFTHALPGMNVRRRNVELRFKSGATLAEILRRHERLAA